MLIRAVTAGMVGGESAKELVDHLCAVADPETTKKVETEEVTRNRDMMRKFFGGEKGKR